MDLPAFLLSKNVFFRVHRNAPGSLGLVWWDLPGRRLKKACGLAFQLDFWASFHLGLCVPLETSPKIKNPASSAGHSHLFFQWLRAKLDRFLARIRRCLTLGSGYCPTDPTVNPLINPADLGIPRTICNYTETPRGVKSLSKLFLKVFLTL